MEELLRHRKAQCILQQSVQHLIIFEAIRQEDEEEKVLSR